MEFQQFNRILAKHVARFTKNTQHLFVVAVAPDALWEKYLESFPAGMNEIFRERREHDCSCCKQYIRSIGNVVAIKAGKLVSVWDFKVADDRYQTVIDALASLVKSAPVQDVFVSPTRKFGTLKNAEISAEGSVNTWYHFCSEFSGSVQVFDASLEGTVRGGLRDSRNVLERSFREISLEALDTVLELIGQKGLYKGEEWEGPLTKFRRLHRAYWAMSEGERSNYCWTTSLEVGPAISRIKNHSIGVLLSDIASGVALDDAVRRYERIVAPTNYKRPKAIFTPKMVKGAENKVKELGLEKSLKRRHARIDDITVHNILWANKDVVRQMSGGVFEELAASVSSKPKNLDRVDEVSVEDFVRDILPTLVEFDVLLENKHASNMVSLIAPEDAKAKPITKWPGGFTWAYSGNITDSMKQRVKAAGGRVDGDLRFSIQWNENNDNGDDLDAHCHEPGGNLISFRNQHRHQSGGDLDVDIVHPNGIVAVENITWPSRSRMPEGEYLLLVRNYSARGAGSGFRAEVEFDGQIFSFDYPRPLKQDQKVEVAKVTLKEGQFTIKPLLSAQESNREVWGLTTQNFYSVSACMHSPNYWDGHIGSGHRHYFFILKDCLNDESPNGFFNEFLDEGLMEHKRVFEALGSKMKVADSDDQLSGLGFSSTKRASLVVRAKGAFTRVLRLNF